MTVTPAKIEGSLKSLLPETLRFLEELVRINSFTRNVPGIRANADRIIRQFTPLGFQAQRIQCSEAGTGEHLVLDTGGDGPVISCISHLDTVYPPEEEERNNFRWEPVGNRIYGPGTLDIKGGTAILWMLMKALSVNDPELFRSIRWMLIWDAAEEGLTDDFGDVCRRVLPANTLACLVFEPDNVREGGFGILRSRKGSVKMRINVTGRGAHCGGQFDKGANAVVQLARLVEKAAALSDLSKDLTVNVGSFHGGIVFNRIPHEAEALIDIRAYDIEYYQSARDCILSFAGEGDVRAASDGFPCTIDVTIVKEIAPFPRNDQTERLISCWTEAAATCGLSLEAGRRGCLSDGNRLWNSFPTLDGLGPRGANGHVSERSPDGSKEPEYVDVTSFVPKTLINYLGVVNLIEKSRG